MKKLFTIRLAIETMDFFAVTPLLAIGDGFGIGWFKWALSVQFCR